MAELTLNDMYRDVVDFRRVAGIEDTTPLDQAVKTVEELGELLAGLVNQDRVETLDGIIDTIYTLVGCAVAGGWSVGQLETAWAKVQASNLTKRRTAGESKISPRGDGYRAPDLEDQSRVGEEQGWNGE